jgi:hypothetical protein
MFEEYHEMINVDMNRVCFFADDDIVVMFSDLGSSSSSTRSRFR